MDTVKHIEADQRGLNRRGFLWASAGGLAGLAILPQEAESARARGWPAKPNEYIQIIENNYTLPNMVAKVVGGTPIKEAIA